MVDAATASARSLLEAVILAFQRHSSNVVSREHPSTEQQTVI